ncbi:hypothetical protein K3553_12580 [Leisingera aquaemixtae]|uniref:hypothetical protein n=1 Tax=Leisingera aquaemixtae TaxID=1396826 RepID=UPI0021A627C1|nr:hypothetical protein [Leisingera aquaemixtae]UWQ23808.1 hypothetical protein K3553_12580 [Leisingera aquaemixtae]
MFGEDFDFKAVPPALDADEVRTVADVNGQAPELCILLYQRYGCSIDFVSLDRKGTPKAPDDATLQGWLARLEQAGVDRDAIRVADTARRPGSYDVILALNGFGARHKIQNFKPLLDRALHPLSRLVIEIRKGSGSYPFLKTYGSCNTLLPPETGKNGLAILSAEPQEVLPPSGEWSRVARQLAGKEGFFDELEEHSFLFMPRGKTLVVTFDNLDIAMTKRDDRRPWGYGFIEAQGWSMLGVMANGWTWFRHPEVTRKFEALRDSGFFTQFSRVVFYGASMGGYAAAAYAAAAPGSTVFAISPQSTLDKTLVPWEMRYKKVWDRDFSGPFGDAAQASQAAGEVHIMFDPYVAPDAAHAARFTGENVRLWRCPLLGHRLGSSLQQMGILQEIARDAIAGGLTAHQFHRLLRKRHSFPRFQRELANLALDRGHPRLAQRVCDYILRQRDDRFFRRLKARL